MYIHGRRFTVLGQRVRPHICNAQNLTHSKKTKYWKLTNMTRKNVPRRCFVAILHGLCPVHLFRTSHLRTAAKLIRPIATVLKE